MKAQYLFIYDALHHAYIHGPTEVKSSQLKEHMDLLTTPIAKDSDSIRSRLDKEFDHVMSIQLPEDHSFDCANELANLPKNRNQNSLPCEGLIGR